MPVVVLGAWATAIVLNVVAVVWTVINVLNKLDGSAMTWLGCAQPLLLLLISAVMYGVVIVAGAFLMSDR